MADSSILKSKATVERGQYFKRVFSVSVAYTWVYLNTKRKTRGWIRARIRTRTSNECFFCLLLEVTKTAKNSTNESDSIYASPTILQTYASSSTVSKCLENNSHSVRCLLMPWSAASRHWAVLNHNVYEFVINWLINIYISSSKSIDFFAVWLNNSQSN